MLSTSASYRFLPVEGVGLAPHVPDLQGETLPEQRCDCLYLSVAPINGMSSIYSMFSYNRVFLGITAIAALPDICLKIAGIR